MPGEYVHKKRKALWWRGRSHVACSSTHDAWRVRIPLSWPTASRCLAHHVAVNLRTLPFTPWPRVEGFEGCITWGEGVGGQWPRRQSPWCCEYEAGGCVLGSRRSVHALWCRTQPLGRELSSEPVCPGRRCPSGFGLGPNPACVVRMLGTSSLDSQVMERRLTASSARRRLGCKAPSPP
jgi:hypothetical protein